MFFLKCTWPTNYKIFSPITFFILKCSSLQIHCREVVAKCTLNPNDISGAGDQPMSRRKSFKKSLRESFRRLRKGRSQRPVVGPKQSSPAAATAPKSHDSAPSSNAGPSTAAEVRPVERQIEARTPDDGMGSMVRCLLMAKTFVLSQSLVTTATCWAGTNSGAIYVFNLAIPAGSLQCFFFSPTTSFHPQIVCSLYRRKTEDGSRPSSVGERNSIEAPSSGCLNKHHRCRLRFPGRRQRNLK